jgi:hypothetical protein
MTPAVLPDKTTPVWPWQAEPYKLWSLPDMLTFYASEYLKFSTRFGELLGIAAEIRRLKSRTPNIPPSEDLQGAESDARRQFIKHVEMLKDMSRYSGIELSAAVAGSIRRLAERGSTADLGVLAELAREAYEGWLDDLGSHLFLSVDGRWAKFYTEPVSGWEVPIERFGCAFDIEEGRKCLALGRYTAAVFHFMKIVESVVLELQVFLKDRDVKAHFGSVLTKLEQMTQQSRYDHVPEGLRPYLPFLCEVLTQLHAVKDSWRNKVSHVDARIVPIDTFTEELAKSVHDATLILITKLAAGMPPAATNA